MLLQKWKEMELLKSRRRRRTVTVPWVNTAFLIRILGIQWAADVCNYSCIDGHLKSRWHHTIVEPSIVKICSEEMRCVVFGFTGRLQQFFGWESLKYISRVWNRSCLENYALCCIGNILRVCSGFSVSIISIPIQWCFWSVEGADAPQSM